MCTAHDATTMFAMTSGNHIMRPGLGLAVIALAALTLAACGSSSKTRSSTTTIPGSTSAAANGSPTTVASSSAPASTAGGSGGAAVDVCKIFPPSAAAKASGLDLSSAKADVAGAPGRFGCTYQSSGTSAADVESFPEVTVYTSASRLTLDTLKVSFDSGASAAAPTQALSGVGDKAWVGTSGVIAQAGSHLVEIAGMAGDITGNHAPSTAMAKAVIAALG